jgi:hypothetical protein
MLGRRASLFGELARLPNSITRVGTIDFIGSQRYPAIQLLTMKVKLPRLMSHPEDSGGIINQQSAIKQLQKRKELHREKAKHLSESKSRTS